MVREREDVKQVYCLDMSGVLSLLLESKSQDEPGMVYQGTRQSVMPAHDVKAFDERSTVIPSGKSFLEIIDDGQVGVE